MDDRQGLSNDRRPVGHATEIPSARGAAISAEILQSLGAELARDDQLHLSDGAIALIRELCVDARRRGVTPERLIVMLKDEIRAATTHDEYRRRPLVDEAVTRCIRLFFASDRAG
jgi:hypothetical protein